MKINKQATKVERKYVFTQKELKENLGIKGNIECAGLFAGLSPNDEKRDVLIDTTEWFIFTVEKKNIKGKV